MIAGKLEIIPGLVPDLKRPSFGTFSRHLVLLGLWQQLPAMTGIGPKRTCAFQVDDSIGKHNLL